jgi:hypothetical protein
MCEVRSKEKRAGTKKKTYNGQQQKEMDCHEPHPAPNEKTQPIQCSAKSGLPGARLILGSFNPTYCTCSRCDPKNHNLGTFERKLGKVNSFLYCCPGLSY